MASKSRKKNKNKNKAISKLNKLSKKLTHNLRKSVSKRKKTGKKGSKSKGKGKSKSKKLLSKMTKTGPPTKNKRRGKKDLKKTINKYPMLMEQNLMRQRVMDRARNERVRSGYRGNLGANFRTGSSPLSPRLNPTGVDYKSIGAATIGLIGMGGAAAYGISKLLACTAVPLAAVTAAHEGHPHQVHDTDCDGIDDDLESQIMGACAGDNCSSIEGGFDMTDGDVSAQDARAFGDYVDHSEGHEYGDQNDNYQFSTDPAHPTVINVDDLGYVEPTVVAAAPAERPAEPAEPVVTDNDCVGHWSSCTDACETPQQRTFTETTAQSGTGAECPAAIDCHTETGCIKDDTRHGGESCVDSADCEGTLVCDSAQHTCQIPKCWEEGGEICTEPNNLCDSNGIIGLWPAGCRPPNQELQRDAAGNVVITENGSVRELSPEELRARDTGWEVGTDYDDDHQLVDKRFDEDDWDTPADRRSEIHMMDQASYQAKVGGVPGWADMKYDQDAQAGYQANMRPLEGADRVSLNISPYDTDGDGIVSQAEVAASGDDLNHDGKIDADEAECQRLGPESEICKRLNMAAAHQDGSSLVCYSDQDCIQPEAWEHLGVENYCIAADGVDADGDTADGVGAGLCFAGKDVNAAKTLAVYRTSPWNTGWVLDEGNWEEGNIHSVSHLS